MKIRILTVFLLLITIPSLSLVVLVQVQPTMLQKGSVIEPCYLSSERSSKPRPPEEIATGVISDPPSASHRWAIIIGISDYSGEANDLQYCDDDALDFYSVLIGTYGWSSRNIKLLINEQAEFASIHSAIDWIRTNEDHNDEVVFFYSGHGSFGTHDADNDGERKDVCIIPWECTPEFFIWDGDLKAEFSN